ncbi:MAG TPA: hypothetical protein VFZ79_00270 [Acidimicrobiales bacterium]
MKARMVVAAGSALVGILVHAAGASAGGWAVTSLDPMSVPVAGEEIDVGFTIRQHGATPVNPEGDGADPVAVVVRSPSGAEDAYPARQEGPTGHYVAAVTFPEVGRAHWAVNQGWFGAHDLGAIDVADALTSGGEIAGAAAAPTEGSAGRHHRWPLAARAGATVVAVAAAGVAVTDAWRSRRRVAGTVAP